MTYMPLTPGSQPLVTPKNTRPCGRSTVIQLMPASWNAVTVRLRLESWVSIASSFDPTATNATSGMGLVWIGSTARRVGGGTDVVVVVGATVVEVARKVVVLGATPTEARCRTDHDHCGRERRDRRPAHQADTSGTRCFRRRKRCSTTNHEKTVTAVDSVNAVTMRAVVPAVGIFWATIVKIRKCHR